MEQGTQTFHPLADLKPNTGGRTNPGGKPPAGRPKTSNGIPESRKKVTLPEATDVSTNTNNAMRGIPIQLLMKKLGTNSGNDRDASASEMSVTPIPMDASRRAKLLPPMVGSLYFGTNSGTLLNTSASNFATNERQRRRSALWLRRPNTSAISPLPERPQSMMNPKSEPMHDELFDKEPHVLPTIESLTEKPKKEKRVLPLLNIIVGTAWADDEVDENQFH